VDLRLGLNLQALKMATVLRSQAGFFNSCIMKAATWLRLIFPGRPQPGLLDFVRQERPDRFQGGVGVIGQQARGSNPSGT